VVFGHKNDKLRLPHSYDGDHRAQLTAEPKQLIQIAYHNDKLHRRLYLVNSSCPSVSSSFEILVMLVRNLSANQLRVSAPAKVNLYLELLGKRPDGFHELETIMTTVSLFDQLSFSSNRSGRLNLSMELVEPARSAGRDNRDGIADTQNELIPTDERNLIIKALILLRRIASQNNSEGTGTDRNGVPGMDVQLKKRIPSAAGLGGASSNAAAALLAGNKLWNLHLSHQQLAEAAAEIGSDVPFFLTGGMAMCRGRGEKVSAIQSPAGLSILIAKPPVGLSTPRVFSQCRLPATPRSSMQAIASVQTGRADLIAGSLLNRLQPAAAGLLEEIGKLEDEFSELPCLGHQMSGSGTSYCGLFRNRAIARAAATRLSARWPALKVHCVTSLSRSGELIA